MTETVNDRNFIKIDISGSVTVVTCLICNGKLEVDIKDNFTPYRQIIKADKPGRPCSVSIKTNKQAFKRFVDESPGFVSNAY